MESEPTTEPTTEPTESEPLATCPVCGAHGTLIELDDGTVYCHAHRGPATAPVTVPTFDGTTAPVAEVLRELGANVVTKEEANEAMSSDEPWPMMAPVRMVAGLIYEAALSTFNEDGTYGDPPTGWAPPPADQSPFMEAGAALAVAVLIEAAEIDRDVIKQLADTFCGRTNETESTNHE